MALVDVEPGMAIERKPPIDFRVQIEASRRTVAAGSYFHGAVDLGTI